MSSVACNAIESFPIHAHLKWSQQNVTFQGHWVLFLKALKCEKSITTHTQPSWLPQCFPILCVCRAVMVGCGEGLHVKWISVLTMVGKTNGHACLKPLCFSHPPAAGEKLLLTLRSRLQILSMLRILSLCGYKESLISSLRISSSFYWMCLSMKTNLEAEVMHAFQFQRTVFWGILVTHQ